jgi:hypothetical protein
MRAKIQFIIILTFLSVLTAGFGAMPANITQFAGAFAIALAFWLCMLGPVYIFNKLK